MSKKSPSLLIVDNDIDDIEFFLEAAASVTPKCHCVSATSGEKAFAYLDDNNNILPDFIFLDLNMPRMDGKKFLTELRKQRIFDSIKVIIYTTSNDPDIKTLTLLGADRIITKPRTFEGICEAIALATGATYSADPKMASGALW